jgi:polyisoprenoid-binding protein YceI
MFSSLLVIGLLGCSGGEEVTPPPNPVDAPPEPLSLVVTGGEIGVMSKKDGDIEVPGRFTTVSGTFKFKDGKDLQGLTGDIELDLSSWDSDLAERDKNVKEYFFDLPTAGTAVFQLTELQGLPEEPLSVGHDAEVTARGWLKMSGAEVAVEPKVKLSRSGDKEFYIDTIDPFYISVDSLGMTDRLKKLMSVCGHESIDDNVAISLRLSLGAKGSPLTGAKLPRRKVGVRNMKVKGGSPVKTKSPTRDTNRGNNNSLNPNKGKNKGGR